MLIKRDTDAFPGQEVFAITFDTFDDLLASDFSAAGVGFSQLDLAFDFDIAGLAYDGQYRMLIERDTDAFPGQEVFAITFDTFEDLLESNITSVGTGFSQLNIAPNFDIGGLAYDGTFKLLVEQTTDAFGGDEVAFAEFETFQDLIDSNITDQGFTQINIAPNFGIGGFVFEPNPIDPVTPVPLPAGAWFLASALGLLALRRRT